jgi:hypothetical protein
MKKITFFGSGIEIENYKNGIPEIKAVVKVVSKYYDELLFGGTNIGIMGEFARNAKENHFKITSIVPKWFAKKHKKLLFKEGKLILVDNLAERKKILSDTDAVLCYPGGVGTLDEFFDLIARILLCETKQIPILIYNFERFYSPILLQIEYCIKTGIIKKEVVDFIYTFEHIDQLEKILEKIQK